MRPQKQMLKIAAFVIIANILDAILTYWFVSNGSATELNPFMGMLLDVDAILFFLVKFAFVFLAIILLLVSKNQKLAKRAIIFCAIIYGIILMIHAHALIFHELL